MATGLVLRDITALPNRRATSPALLATTAPSVPQFSLDAARARIRRALRLRVLLAQLASIILRLRCQDVVAALAGRIKTQLDRRLARLAPADTTAHLARVVPWLALRAITAHLRQVAPNRVQRATTARQSPRLTTVAAQASIRRQHRLPAPAAQVAHIILSQRNRVATLAPVANIRTQLDRRVARLALADTTVHRALQVQ